MFDNYVLSDNTIKNVSDENGSIKGFEMKTRITYYRGIPLSMVHDVEVDVDGEKIERDQILFSVDGNDFFTLDEMETVTSNKWEYGEEATVFVVKEGGLSKGRHKVTLATTIRTEYIPVPFTGRRTVETVIS